MLVIDDEADNASVNTKKDETDPTKTNKLIRQICTLFKDTTYVGFTATPFANVFIDPDSVDSMKNADLFPEHFIYALEAPSNYVGAQRYSILKVSIIATYDTLLTLRNRLHLRRIP